MYIQVCAETHTLVIAKETVAFFKKNFIFLCSSSTLKCLGMAHSGLFITCVFPFLILCMRKTLAKIIISIWVFNQFKMKFLCDFQDHNTCGKEQVVSTDSSKTQNCSILSTVCVNNLYKNNFILTDVEVLVVTNLSQLNGSFRNQWKLMCLYIQTSILYHFNFMEHYWDGF